MCKQSSARRVPLRHGRHQREHRAPAVTRHAAATRRRTSDRPAGRAGRHRSDRCRQRGDGARAAGGPAMGDRSRPRVSDAGEAVAARPAGGADAVLEPHRTGEEVGLRGRDRVPHHRTGRPWQARRTPATTLLRLKGSTTPLRLTTASTASSTVVNRRPHAGHERRRRVVAPSSASRESMTRLSALWQNGQRTALTSSWSGGSSGDVLWTSLGTSGGCPRENLRNGLWTGSQPCNY